MKKRMLLSVLICTLIISLALSPALAASISVKINASTKVYQSASKSAKSANVKSGLKVSLTDYSDGWGKITYKGNTAYIPVEYLTFRSAVKMYTASSAPVYKKAGSTKLGTVAAGTEVYVVGLSGKYARCKPSKSSSSVGYIRTYLLTKNKVYSSNGGTSEVSTGTPGTYSSSSGTTSTFPSSLKSTTTSASVSKIEYTIYVAQNLVGAPYSSSSKPPKSFDCATFTKWCYGKAKSGVLTSSAKSQGYDSRYQMITNVSALKRGDLVSFDTILDSDSSDHVGIYLGSGKFIHCSSAAGMVVVSDLTSGYYNRVFFCGRRIFSD